MNIIQELNYILDNDKDLLIKEFNSINGSIPFNKITGFEMFPSLEYIIVNYSYISNSKLKDSFSFFEIHICKMIIRKIKISKIKNK